MISKHALEDIVTLDETGINNQMIRLYGRAEGKNRVYDCVKHKPEIKMTLLSGLSINGLVAPFEFEGYLDMHTFYYYLKDIMLPELKVGQVLVMDNLSSHKGK